MENFALMIFAAGFGTRMGELTRSRPKPMIEVGGKALIDRAMDLARNADMGPIVVNVHYLAEMLEEHLADADVQISRETPEILDTGGGLKAALPMIDAPVVATMNPDVVWSGPNPLRVAIQSWAPERMDALLLCVPIERTIGRTGGGDFDLAQDGSVSRPGNLVYGGVQIIKTERVAEMQEKAFSLNAVWNKLAAENRVCFEIYDGHWCDVGSPSGIALAEEMIARDV